ncbi:MAG TPA: acetyl-CoA carboxylase carboxyltransferase subunit beta [Oscillospiraceae bacterium]|nr:acetyl-CoA carboxylase carboxyltransferase subunit beta [Oscillospiraceae bacterium]
MPLGLRFRKPKNELEQGGRPPARPAERASEMTRKCPDCGKEIPLGVLWEGGDTCPCGHCFPMRVRRRVAFLTDPDSFTELFGALESRDFLGFPGYAKKLRNLRESTGEREAVLCGEARIEGHACALFVMDPYFLMGSMGTVVGEKIARLFEYAAQKRLPVVGCAVSGGARMQEGILSLMQMAKTSAAVKRHGDGGNFYLALLTDPTMGGVTASFAMQGDIILAEPGATVGFAGARVVEQTVRKKPPADFQKAEVLLAHGFADAIVPRAGQRRVVASLLAIHERRRPDEKGL